MKVVTIVATDDGELEQKINDSIAQITKEKRRLVDLKVNASGDFENGYFLLAVLVISEVIKQPIQVKTNDQG